MDHDSTIKIEERLRLGLWQHAWLSCGRYTPLNACGQYRNEEISEVKVLVGFPLRVFNRHFPSGSTNSLHRSANSLQGIEEALIGFRKLLPGAANTYRNLRSFLLGFQKSNKGDAKSRVGSRNTEIGVRSSYLSTGNSQQLFGVSEISTRRSPYGVVEFQYQVL